MMVMKRGGGGGQRWNLRLICARVQNMSPPNRHFGASARSTLQNAANKSPTGKVPFLSQEARRHAYHQSLGIYS